MVTSLEYTKFSPAVKNKLNLYEHEYKLIFFQFNMMTDNALHFFAGAALLRSARAGH